MNIHPEELCREIAGEMIIPAGETWAFHSGTRPDSNFDLDELEGEQFIILDLPISSNDKPAQSTYIGNEFPLSILFAYKTELDDNDGGDMEADNLDKRKKAWAASKHFVQRLMRHPSVKAVLLTNMKRTEFDKLFDINLCGVLLTLTISIHDDAPSCV